MRVLLAPLFVAYSLLAVPLFSCLLNYFLICDGVVEDFNQFLLPSCEVYLRKLWSGAVLDAIFSTLIVAVGPKFGVAYEIFVTVCVIIFH